MSLRYLIDTNVLVYLHDQSASAKRARLPMCCAV